MDEAFLRQAMTHLGQEGIVSIKVMTNKFTGEPAGYGFINFDSDHRAVLTMHRLGGKVIPNSNPPVRFKLNHNSTRLQPGEPDTSIWVGDLTPEVDDYALYQFFTQRYQSVRCAKVVLDDAGFSKGYGFVRFASEGEQQHALSQMSGEVGLGSKPIKVSMANQKNRSGPGSAVGVQPALQNGAGGGMPTGTWAATLDVQVGAGGPGGTGAPTGAPDPPGWPGIQSQHWQGTPVAAVAAAAAAAVTGVPGATAAPIPAHPDFSAYHQNLQQYYQQYAQQFSQQQQFAAAWNAWQHTQQ